MSSFQDILEGIDLWVALLWVLLIVGLIVAAVKVVPTLRAFAAFLSDVAGEPARPGRERVPGLFERLSNMEASQKTMQNTQQEVLQKVSVIHHEVFPNSGKSLRDQTNRIEDKVSKDFKEIGKLKETVTGLGETVVSLEKVVTEHISTSTDIIKTITEEKNS